METQSVRKEGAEPVRHIAADILEGRPSAVKILIITDFGEFDSNKPNIQWPIPRQKHNMLILLKI
ncbi:hypothetical protein DSCOOX_45290 [Desulfosarcina ovata subsp. ovata]|uniref:Uncharacterized protein n=1 Tax=Desulfosarcina ovata subsp. ovata TaxID=2752305 RepID=A0A5K8AFN9_9BACT|nr:hypothetical protein DSCOOX_45290 [Desulfosarcina ovata subsp. ovata]